MSVACLKGELFFVDPGVKSQWTVFVGYLAVIADIKNSQFHLSWADPQWPRVELGWL